MRCEGDTGDLVAYCEEESNIALEAKLGHSLRAGDLGGGWSFPKRVRRKRFQGE